MAARQTSHTDDDFPIDMMRDTAEIRSTRERVKVLAMSADFSRAKILFRTGKVVCMGAEKLWLY